MSKIFGHHQFKKIKELKIRGKCSIILSLVVIALLIMIYARSANIIIMVNNENSEYVTTQSEANITIDDDVTTQSKADVAVDALHVNSRHLTAKSEEADIGKTVIRPHLMDSVNIVINIVINTSIFFFTFYVSFTVVYNTLMKFL